MYAGFLVYQQLWKPKTLGVIDECIILRYLLVLAAHVHHFLDTNLALMQLQEVSEMKEVVNRVPRYPLLDEKYLTHLQAKKLKCVVDFNDF